MRIAVEGPELTSVKFEEILEIFKLQNIIMCNLFMCTVCMYRIKLDIEDWNCMYGWYSYKYSILQSIVCVC